MGYPAKGRDRTTWRRRGLFLWATLPKDGRKLGKRDREGAFFFVSLFVDDCEGEAVMIPTGPMLI